MFLVLLKRVFQASKSSSRRTGKKTPRRERLEEAASTTGFLEAPKGVRNTGTRASA